MNYDMHKTKPYRISVFNTYNEGSSPPLAIFIQNLKKASIFKKNLEFTGFFHALRYALHA